ncbi:MAG TPA: hypothetical protein VKR79_11795 [Gaiellaceae bacterium]|nr:hypothetical protein [Gaiellaceae bacterium]
MKTLAIGTAVSVLALAACGSGGGGGSTLTKAQYDAKVSRLCLVNADAFRELHLDDTVGDYKAFGSSIIHLDQSFATKLAALKPPSSIASEASAFGKANALAAQDDKDAVAAAKAGDAAKLKTLIAKYNHDEVATYPSAKAMGARDCYFP